MMKSGSLSFDSGDVVLERDCGTHKAAVLCGGACGEKAARLTAEALAGLLSFDFERCMTDQPAELWREAADLIAEALAGAGEAGAGLSAWTMMAAAMDQQGRWCLFHLGEGLAMGKTAPGRDWAVLSRPQRDLLPGGAGQTADSAMYGGLRFCRQVHPADRGLILMSDGALERFRAAPPLLQAKALPEGAGSMAWLMTLPEL